MQVKYTCPCCYLLYQPAHRMLLHLFLREKKLSPGPSGRRAGASVGVGERAAQLGGRRRQGRTSSATLHRQPARASASALPRFGSADLRDTTPRAGCGRSEEGRYGRTVEAIEQPIAAPASSPVGAQTRMWFVRDVRLRTYGNPCLRVAPALPLYGMGCADGAKARCVTAAVRACGSLHGKRTECRLMCLAAVCALVCARKTAKSSRSSTVTAHGQKSARISKAGHLHFRTVHHDTDNGTSPAALGAFLLGRTGKISRFGRPSQCSDTILHV
jgi:hypothetical protein